MVPSLYPPFIGFPQYGQVASFAPPTPPMIFVISSLLNAEILFNKSYP
jgi:hypothetical protein